MTRAAYAHDAVVILDSGQLLAEGTPAAIRAHADGGAMEDAFVAIVAAARAKAAAPRQNAA